MPEREDLFFRFRTIQETLMSLGRATLGQGLAFERDKYADGLVKKASLQLLAIRNLSEQGQWYSTVDNSSYNYIIDPLAVSAILRGAYECMLTLNHVYINPHNQDEVELRYLFWALSTFISKDRATPALYAEGQQMRDQNRINLESTVNSILNLNIVAALNRESKDTIRSKLNAGAGDNWEYYIDGVRLLRVQSGLHGLAERIPAQAGVFNNLYKLFSLNSHPTWHSIDVVDRGFETGDDEPANLRMMDTLLECSAIIGAFIIYDYCTLFNVVRGAFNELPSSVKEVVNFQLITFKGEEFRL